MKMKILHLIMILLIGVVTACSQDHSNKKLNSTENVEVTVSAAASLKNVLEEIKSNFEDTNNHITILYNLGGSGALKQQIIQGAPTDIFISAAKDQFEELKQKGLIDKENQSNLLGNQLVLITNKANPAHLENIQDLSKKEIEKVAIGVPETVPAGMYAKQTLKHFKLWEEVQPKLIQTKDVRQVLTYVETGSVDAGMVYITDVDISDKVEVAVVADEDSHDPIIYSAGMIKATTHKKEAERFYDYLKSKKAKAIFKKYGFKVLD